MAETYYLHVGLVCMKNSWPWSLWPGTSPAPLSPAARVTVLRFGCRLPFATQDRNSSIKPPGCQLAFHTPGGVVPLDDRLAGLQKSNYGSPVSCIATVNSLLLAPSPAVGQYGAARSATGRHGGDSPSLIRAAEPVVSAEREEGSYGKPVLLLLTATCSQPSGLFSTLRVQVKDPDWGLSIFLTSKQNAKHKRNLSLQHVSELAGQRGSEEKAADTRDSKDI